MPRQNEYSKLFRIDGELLNCDEAWTRYVGQQSQQEFMDLSDTTIDDAVTRYVAQVNDQFGISLTDNDLSELDNALYVSIVRQINR